MRFLWHRIGPCLCYGKSGSDMEGAAPPSLKLRRDEVRLRCWTDPFSVPHPKFSRLTPRPSRTSLNLTANMKSLRKSNPHLAKKSTKEIRDRIRESTYESSLFEGARLFKGKKGAALAKAASKKLAKAE